MTAEDRAGLARSVAGRSATIAPGLIFRVAALAIVLAVGLDTAADTDLWGHVRFGMDLLQTRSIEHVDPYSFTSDRPWINHEWLAELAMGAAFAGGGAAGLVGVKLALLVASLGIASWSIDRRTGPGAAGAAILLFTGLTGVVPLLSTLRPHGFSVLVFVTLAAILASEQRGGRLLWSLPPLFAVWANLHGGWLMGFGTLAVWMGAHVLLPTGTSIKRSTLAMILVVTLLSTAVNPYGIGLWRFLWQTVGFNRSDIVEWLPLTRLPELLAPWALTVALAAFAAVTRRAPWPPVLACALLAAAAFRVGRMVPFFSIAVGLLLLPSLARPRTLDRPSPRWLPIAAMSVAGLITLASAGLQGKSIACIPPLPALELDADANSFLRANRLSGRLLVWFNWGEYAIWHFSPQLKVSMDGRRETVYSATTLQSYQDLIAGGPPAGAYFDRLNPDVVWLPARAPLNEHLAGRGWRPAFEGTGSIVWVRASDARPFAPPAPRLPACFPGP